MNQLPRIAIAKCIECGEDMSVRQVYDKHTSQYVTCQIPLCRKCEYENEKRRYGNAISDLQRRNR